MQSSTPPQTDAAARDASTGELPPTITHLLAAAERERSALSRTLHDELGGLLVSAVMDVGWAEQHLGSMDDVRQRLTRVRQSLAAAIDLKRNLIEDLRPSLLDNFGLFAAFRWFVKQSGERAGVTFTESYPPEEPAFRLDASTALFRIMQATLAVIRAERDVDAVHINVSTDADDFVMDIEHEHKAAETVDLFQGSPVEMSLIAHRTGLLGGVLTVERGPASTLLSARFPLAQILVAR